MLNKCLLSRYLLVIYSFLIKKTGTLHNNPHEIRSSRKMSVFGSEFAEIWPKAGAGLELTDFGRKLLEKCRAVEKPDISKVDVQEFMQKSEDFPIEFGTNTCRVRSQPKERWPHIKQQIASAYPVIHERVLGLYLAFLEHKCKYGNEIELKVYEQQTLTSFVHRLLTKRCVAFVSSDDDYYLISGERGNGGFEQIGSLSEQPPLTLDNVLSYDEIKLSALLSVSSHTEFLNNGNRYNAGRPEPDKTKFEPAGVVVGIIGARFERPHVMEYEDIVISEEQNTVENGYGPKEHSPLNRREDYRRLWNQLYEENDILYCQDIQGPRFCKYASGGFDNILMKKRYTLSIDTLLLEAESRAAAAGKMAYVHVVGIGLGVWKILPHQTEIFVETFMQRLRALMPKLSHVGVVDYSYFHMEKTDLLVSQTHPLGGIKIFFSERNPADKLATEFSDMLIIASYAWDGNALPGNEFWFGSLTGSGDPAAACSTLITELHNAHINTDMVNGNNLHIATLDNGLVHISEYSSKYLQ